MAGRIDTGYAEDDALLVNSKYKGNRLRGAPQEKLPTADGNQVQEPLRAKRHVMGTRTGWDGGGPIAGRPPWNRFQAAAQARIKASTRASLPATFMTRLPESSSATACGPGLR